MKKLLLVAAIFAISTSALFSDDATPPPGYRSTHTPIPQGKAPGLKWKLVSDVDGVKEYVLIFGQGDEVLSGVLDFATKNNIKNAHIAGIGAFSKATAAWYDREKRMFKLNPINEEVEVGALIGDIATTNGKPAPHIHFAASRADATMLGGHLIEGYVFPTMEVYITAYDKPIYKKLLKEGDLDVNVIDLDAKE
jgi:predicted DNA-binding protein with PD1-like motif